MSLIFNLPKITEQIVLDTAVIQQARANSRQTRQSIMIELESLTQAAPRDLVNSIAQLFGLQVMGTADMLVHLPAFDLLPLSKAMQRHCVLLRSTHGKMLGVISDPFDSDLQTWLHAQATRSKFSNFESIKGTEPELEIYFALQSDIQAYLTKQEETVKAVDMLAPTEYCPTLPIEY